MQTYAWDSVHVTRPVIVKGDVDEISDKSKTDAAIVNKSGPSGKMPSPPKIAFPKVTNSAIS
jgi:hypothetical protein